MSTNVVRLERLFRRTWDWSPRELAEFYRVEAALIQAGMRIDTERGLSDEGDPWFSFCRQDNAEVIVHIARIGGVYILAGASYDGVASGGDIAALVHDLVSRHPLVQVRGDTRRPGAKIFLHPAALLIAVVATAFFKSAEARALTDEQKAGEVRGGGGAALKTVSGADGHHSVVMDAAQSVAILSAVAVVLQAATPPVSEHDNTINSVASTSDVVDFAILSPPEVHSVSSLSAPLPTGFEVHQGGEAHLSSGLLNNAPAHLVEFANTPAHFAEVVNAPAHFAEVANALPLIAVLWDLFDNRPITKTIGNDTGYAPAAPIITNPTPLATESPIVTFRLLPTNDVNNSLPVIQAAKISYTGGHGVVETHIVAQPQPDALPATLANVLQGATHSAIDGQPMGVPNVSFANGLISSLTNQPGNETHANTPASPPTSSPPTSSPPTSSPPTAASLDTTTQPSQPVSHPATPDHQNASDLQAVVQDFIKSMSNVSVVNDGKGVVVYDTGALNSHPSEVKSVTFDFSDGSTLSLVGLPATLPHLHLG